jgi:polar amino acid transport system substrate-binding protein
MRLAKTFATLATLLALTGAAAAQSCTSKVPDASLIDKGKWQMSINPTLPPQQFVDDKGELQGLNVELAKDIAKRLCLEAVFMRMDFPPMIPGLKANRFDTINTGMFWTEERSKMFYVVPYAQQAISVYTDPKSTLTIGKIEDLSGHIVGIETATYTERKAKEMNEQMVAKGLKPMDIRTFSTVTETSAALRAGQLEAAMNIGETAIALQQRGIAKIHLKDLVGTDITFAFRDKALATAFAAALTAAKADGTYDKLFDKFGMTRLTGTTFAIRGDGPAN